MDLKTQMGHKLIQIRQKLIDLGEVKNKTEFAKSIGSHATVISEMGKGKRTVNVKIINNLINKYGDHFEPNEFFGPDKEEDYIMFLTDASAGPSIPSNNVEKVKKFSLPDIKGKHFAFRVSGDSMIPTLENKDILVCEEVLNRLRLQNGKIYVVSSNEGINVKRIQLQKEKGHITGLSLLSDNENIQEIKIDFTEGLHQFPFLKFYLPIRRITQKGIE